VSARTPELDPRQIREYLLRRMPDSVRTRFEEAYFKDDTLLDRIEVEEDLLVSDYVLGRLTQSDRRRFEQSLLGMPYYQERVHTTSQLKLQVSRLSFRPRMRGGAGRAEPEDDSLFPGRSGATIAFAVLAVLLVAAVTTSVKLKSELDRKSAPPASPAAQSAPVLQTIVFEPETTAGPHVRRLVRQPSIPLLFVIPRVALPSATREWRLLVVGPDGNLAWESPLQKLSDVPPGGDLSVRLPADAPPAGRSSILVKAGGVFEDALLPLGLVEIVE
jgi:hypothetical protein